MSTGICRTMEPFHRSIDQADIPRNNPISIQLYVRTEKSDRSVTSLAMRFLYWINGFPGGSSCRCGPSHNWRLCSYGSWNSPIQELLLSFSLRWNAAYWMKPFSTQFKDFPHLAVQFIYRQCDANIAAILTSWRWDLRLSMVLMGLIVSLKHLMSHFTEHEKKILNFTMRQSFTHKRLKMKFLRTSRGNRHQSKGGVSLLIGPRLQLLRGVCVAVDALREEETLI